MLPKTLKILGHPVAVRTDKESYGAELGLCESNDLWIAVDPNRPISQIEETTLHEIIEMILRLLDVDEQVPHSIISQLAVSLHQTFHDNPAILRFLLESTKKKRKPRSNSEAESLVHTQVVESANLSSATKE